MQSSELANSNNMNSNMGSGTGGVSPYNIQQQIPQPNIQNIPNMPNQQYPPMQPYNTPYQPPNSLYLQPYPHKPRGRGRPPKNINQQPISHPVHQQISHTGPMGQSQPKSK